LNAAVPLTVMVLPYRSAAMRSAANRAASSAPRDTLSLSPSSRTALEPTL
jgi:hypothetical protein